jgi:nucleoside-diphosphate-sugar epimerase
LVDALRPAKPLLVHCGTIWVHGPARRVPITEDEPRTAFGDYGVGKAEIEAYLLEESRGHGLPATALHPGHLVGPGHEPVNPQGNMNTGVFETLARGEELALPNVGLETLHHVHADDVAQAFQRVLERPEASVGESFHVVSPAALTMRGYAESVAGWFGQEARLRFLPWDEWRRTVSAADAAMTWDHVAHSPCGSIAKAQRLLGYEPRYSSLDAVRESVAWLARNGVLSVPALE